MFGRVFCCLRVVASLDAPGAHWGGRGSFAGEELGLGYFLGALPWVVVVDVC